MEALALLVLLFFCLPLRTAILEERLAAVCALGHKTYSPPGGWLMRLCVSRSDETEYSASHQLAEAGLSLSRAVGVALYRRYNVDELHGQVLQAYRRAQDAFRSGNYNLSHCYSCKVIDATDVLMTWYNGELMPSDVTAKLDEILAPVEVLPERRNRFQALVRRSLALNSAQSRSPGLNQVLS